MIEKFLEGNKQNCSSTAQPEGNLARYITELSICV